MADHGDSRECVLRASRGDEAAVGELLERHLSSLFAFVRLNTGELLGAKESHADLVQSTCRELLENLDGFDYRGEAQFKHWLFTAALNKIRKKVRHYRADKRDFRREASPRQSDSDPLDLAGLYGATPSNLAIANEQVQRIEAAFSELSEEQRQVITLVRICGLTHGQVAAELGVSEVAARKLYSRASARLILKLRG